MDRQYKGLDYPLPYADRIFTCQSENGLPVIPSGVVEYDSTYGISHLPSGSGGSPLVITVDGACRGNGTGSAEASYSIFYGRNSPYNTCGRLPSRIKWTSQAAELFAAKKAIKFARERRNFHSRTEIKEVIIQTDSEYVVNCLSIRHSNGTIAGFI
ncbi:hypothetical protein G7Y89_g4098 [Cudoniella acicularis]|uniref:ribonuclease H n=1 Tax=Cudoniella acicularis TaxID=354080 RepID=A0A8H4W713_9HELO|nr:hypothetical protein G7Y89_g4098 [Cudoniella acicularis]